MKRLLVISLVILFFPLFCNAAWEDSETRDKYCTITIDHTKVDAALSDFPVLLTSADFPTNMLDSDETTQCAQNGGGDIRFSSTNPASVITQIPCEVVNFITNSDPSASLADVWVSVSSLSSVSDTIIYCAWSTTGTSSQPTVDSLYGAEKVWGSSYALVYHMNENPGGTAPQISDSTSNDNNGTTFGTMTSGDLITGGIGKAIELDGSNDFINCGMGLADNPSQLTLFVVAKNTNKGMIFSHRSETTRLIQLMSQSSSEMRLQLRGSGNIIEQIIKSSIDLTSDYYSISGIFDKINDSHKLVFNDSAAVTSTHNFGDETFTSTKDYIGAYNDEGSMAGFFDGIIDELHISSTARSAAWAKASYYSADSNFVTFGAITDITSAGTTWKPISIGLF